MMSKNVPPIRIACLFASIVLAHAGGGCAARRAPEGAFVEQAERLHSLVLKDAVTGDTDLNEYVQLVGRRLVDAARKEAPGKAAAFRDMRFHLVYSPVVNAFPTGGPHVYVYNGLLQACDTEEELAAAMAHAYAHAINLDVEDTGIRPDPDLPMRLVMWQFVNNRFTVEQERAADALAYRLYCRAGYDPRQFEFLFQKLADNPRLPTAPDRLPLTQRPQLASAGARRPARDWRQLPVADPRTFLSLRAQARAFQEQNEVSLAAHNIVLAAFPNCVLSGDLPEQLAAQEKLRPPPPPAAAIEPN